MRPGETAGPALTAIAHDILGKGRGALDDIARQDAAPAVHDYRKVMKRWRGFLKLVEPFLPPRDRWLRITARDLARQLASARDGQAALDALADLEGADLGLSKTSWATMRSRIEAARHSAELRTLTPELRTQLDAALTMAAHSVDAWGLHSVSFHALAGELARHYERARDAVASTAWDEAAPEHLHELRKRVVVHRYQMELIEPVWPRFGKLWIAEAQRLRERLGSHQDLVVLAGLTAPHQVLAPWRSRLTPLIETRKAAHRAAARRLAGRLFAERPKAFRRRIEALWGNAAKASSPADAAPAREDA